MDFGIHIGTRGSLTMRGTMTASLQAENQVLTAKLLSPEDALAGGRVIAGVGSGWRKEEFDALDTPPVAERGAVTDEYRLAWKALWTDDAPALQGRHVDFRDVVIRPLPLSRPHPPIWVDGGSGAASRTWAIRDIRLPTTPGSRLRHPRGCKPASRRLHCAAEAAGRNPATIEINDNGFQPLSWEPVIGADGQRQCFTGRTDDMLEDAAALRGLGVRHLVIDLQQPTLDATLEVQQRFAEDVVRKAS